MRTMAILMCMLAIGCEGQPLPEFNAKDVLPMGVTVDDMVAMRFARELQSRLGLNIVYQKQPTKNPHMDDVFIVQLGNGERQRTTVTIILDKPSRTVCVRVSGDPRSLSTGTLVKDISTIYSELYPGHELQLFARRQGLFGP